MATSRRLEPSIQKIKLLIKLKGLTYKAPYFEMTLFIRVKCIPSFSEPSDMNKNKLTEQTVVNIPIA